MNVILISTYELGRQPFGLVSPAAWLRKRGHDVTCFDLTRQSLNEAVISSARLIAIYLPMHTATRLACKLIPSLRAQNPQAHLCCYGLYAPMNADYLRSLGVSKILGGEFEAALADLADRLASGHNEAVVGARFSTSPALAPAQSEPTISLERLKFELPDRSGLPAIAKYAHLIIPGDGFRIVGSTEASRGCKHLCRHCPIVPVYNGVFRIIDREIVLADIRQQVAAGAQHISFGDPDFFNGIKHALELIEAFHREYPAITYDVTIKIEHLRKHEQHLARLRDTGCLFVISAVESVDDAILQHLDKGHSRKDFLHVARKFRELNMTLHPTFVPFTPWTTLDGYRDLLSVIADEQLIESVSPIQLGIRLLIPKGSRLLVLDEIQISVAAFDGESLLYPWRNLDPRVDALGETVQAIAADADRKKQSRPQAFARIWQSAHDAAGMPARALPSTPPRPVPFLSEPWYCCAEPTKDQFVSIGVAAAAPATVAAQHPIAAADGFI
jgi:radical SAM superfamily enzyme YgiQ (UPF0313 family)